MLVPLEMQEPVWLALIAALGGGVVGFLSSFVTVILNNRTLKETAEETNRLIQSGRNRETLLLAQDLWRRRDEDPQNGIDAEALVRAVVKMRDITPDDAILVEEVSRTVNEGILNRVDELKKAGKQPRFQLEAPEVTHGGEVS